MGLVRSASLLVSRISSRMLAGVIAKVGKLLGFSEHLQQLKSHKCFPGGHLPSPGVTDGFSTSISTGVEGQLA